MSRGQEKLSAPCLHRLAKHCSAAELSLYKNVNNNNKMTITTKQQLTMTTTRHGNENLLANYDFCRVAARYLNLTT